MDSADTSLADVLAIAPAASSKAIPTPRNVPRSPTTKSVLGKTSAHFSDAVITWSESSKTEPCSGCKSSLSASSTAIIPTPEHLGHCASLFSGSKPVPLQQSHTMCPCPSSFSLIVPDCQLNSQAAALAFLRTSKATTTADPKIIRKKRNSKKLVGIKYVITVNTVYSFTHLTEYASLTLSLEINIGSLRNILNTFAVSFSCESPTHQPASSPL